MVFHGITWQDRVLNRVLCRVLNRWNSGRGVTEYGGMAAIMVRDCWYEHIDGCFEWCYGVGVVWKYGGMVDIMLPGVLPEAM